MDRFWLLTWTTYGTWLPGDIRGSVTSVKEGEGPRHRHNRHGTAYDGPMPGLRRSALDLMKGDPVWLEAAHAAVALQQFQEIANHRKWTIMAAAIMANHVHLVVGVQGDPNPADLLQDFKSYSSRQLNAEFGRPDSGTWWTKSGSRRKLPNEPAVTAAVKYVLEQEKPLVTWPIHGERGT